MSAVPPLPVRPSNATATNFIVLGYPRCGSNLLLSSLGGHPQIRIIGEVLSHEAKIRAEAWERVDPSKWPASRGAGYQLGEDGAAFLANKIFPAGPIRNLRCFGFKIFYDHAQFDDHVSTAWDYLRSSDIKVIHLIRRNLLYSYISFLVA